MRAALAIAFAAGCYSPTPPSGAPCGEGSACPAGQECIAGYCGGGGPTLDVNEVNPDLFVADTQPACQSWGARHFDACGLPEPVGDLVLTTTGTDYSWDTDTGNLRAKMNVPVPVVTTVMSQTGGPDYLLASVDNFTIEAGTYLDIHGSRPLVIAVNGTATIDGDIDAVASFSTPGPGGVATFGSTECPAAQVGNNGAAAVALGAAGTGGGGGGFGGGGGDGGNMGGANGTPFASPPSLIRGGCPGGLGGAGSAATTAARGAGGGALVIAARVAIVVSSTGNINAGGGAGGGGRANFGGGGGGGSGGLLGLDAPVLTISGTLAANGGGGGGGASDTNAGTAGNNAAGSDSEASGGAGATTTTVGPCSRGGNGGAGGDLTGDTGASSLCGGGGGGGGTGYILFWSAAPTVNASATISPAAASGP